MKTLAQLIMVASMACACSSPSASRTGVDEPLVVKMKSPADDRLTVLAQFIPGKLPGTALPTTAQGTVAATDASVPQTLLANVTNYSESYVYQGQGNVPIAGIASSDVSAVAFALEGLSTGYWVVPVGSIDPSTNRPTWGITADFAPSVPKGFRNLEFVAIDGNGNAGTIQSQKICVASRVPDGCQGCVPTPKPPKAVISLTWDTNVDLDLQVMTPEGRLVEPKNPLTSDIDAGTTVSYVPCAGFTGPGRIDRDSDASCVIDNIRTENLVWVDTAPQGTYGIYVNLFDACKQAAVHFNVQVYTATDSLDGGTKVLTSWYSWDGILLDFQANGGSNIGYFVSNFKF